MGRLTAYGHSWVQGDGASTSATRMVDVAARALGLDADNRGVGGTLSTDTAVMVAAQPPPVAAVYLLMTGLNDARLHGPSGNARRRYGSAVDAVLASLCAANPEAVVLVVEQPRLVEYGWHAPYDRGSDRHLDAYNRVLRSTAARHRRAVVATVAHWRPRTMLADDTVHPNDCGHAAVAHAVVAALPDGAHGASTSMAAARPVHD